eukprot:5633280-Alexandrium_andersonii.AAC.1
MGPPPLRLVRSIRERVLGSVSDRVTLEGLLFFRVRICEWPAVGIRRTSTCLLYTSPSPRD